MLPMEWILTLDYFAGDPNQEYFDDGMKRSQKTKRNSIQNLYYLWRTSGLALSLMSSRCQPYHGPA